MSGRNVVLVSLCGMLALAGPVHAGSKADPAQVARGAYLVNLGGCNDCHSPKVFTPEGIPMPDESKLLSGHPAGSSLPETDPRVFKPGHGYYMSSGLTAFIGPWGTSYAANLTPDEQTGIGLWTEDVFIKAIRTGKHMGDGRPILPPMPWPGLASVNDDDLKAMFAYLKSLPLIKNAVPAPVPPPAAGH